MHPILSVEMFDNAVIVSLPFRKYDDTKLESPFSSDYRLIVRDKDLILVDDGRRLI